MPFQEWMNYLPEWAEYRESSDQVYLDPDVVYPMFLKKIEETLPEQLGVVANPTWCAIEAARLLFTRTIKKIMYNYNGVGLRLHLLASKQKPQKNWWYYPQYHETGVPVDIGVMRATLGLDGVLGKQ